MNSCKVCNNELETVISFGEMPISNRFVLDLTEDEFLYDLSIGFCPKCFMVQLEECVDPGMMFNEDYAYFSSISEAMEGHFEEMANEIIEFVSEKPSPFVVELGCNDVIILNILQKKKNFAPWN